MWVAPLPVHPRRLRRHGGVAPARCRRAHRWKDHIARARLRGGPRHPCRTHGTSITCRVDRAAVRVLPSPPVWYRSGSGPIPAGSIRIPAALCGAVGLKPTFDLVPVAGVQPLSTTLDHVGPLGVTVADCAYAMSALVADGSDFADGLDHGIAGHAVRRTHRGTILTSAARRSSRTSTPGSTCCVSLGADCVEITIPRGDAHPGGRVRHHSARGFRVPRAVAPAAAVRHRSGYPDAADSWCCAPRVGLPPCMRRPRGDRGRHHDGDDRSPTRGVWSRRPCQPPPHRRASLNTSTATYQNRSRLPTCGRPLRSTCRANQRSPCRVDSTATACRSAFKSQPDRATIDWRFKLQPPSNRHHPHLGEFLISGSYPTRIEPERDMTHRNSPVEGQHCRTGRDLHSRGHHQW